MIPQEISSLLGAYGFTMQFERPEESKARFQKDTGGFIDIWISRKGMTIGVYNPKAKSMYYVRNANINKLEDQLIKYQAYG